MYADPNQENGNGELPLNTAIFQYQHQQYIAIPPQEFISTLLLSGANINQIETCSGHPPIVQAVTTKKNQEGTLTLVNQLLEYGADPRVTGSEDRLAITGALSLDVATQLGLYEVTKLLLKHGAHVIINNRPTKNNRQLSSPLERSIKIKRDDITELLLSYDANPSQESESREQVLSPLGAAFEAGTVRSIELLMLYGANRTFHFADDEFCTADFFKRYGPGAPLPADLAEKTALALSFDRETFKDEDKADKMIALALSSGHPKMALTLWRAGMKDGEETHEQLAKDDRGKLFTLFDSQDDGAHLKRQYENARGDTGENLTNIESTRKKEKSASTTWEL